jgi:hypothetical protein
MDRDTQIKEKLYLAEKYALQAAGLGDFQGGYERICRVQEIYAEAKALMELGSRKYTTT